MKSVPIRHITAQQPQHSHTGQFSIRDIQLMIGGRDLIHELHRHDFYFVLVIENGSGIHEIDFVKYQVDDHTIFILHPGQVHRLELSSTTTGFIMEFDPSFYKLGGSIMGRRRTKAIGKAHCVIDEIRYQRMHAILTAVLSEYTEKQESYIDAINANLDLFFIEYLRQCRNPKTVGTSASEYAKQRFEELQHLLESNITSVKSVSEYASMLNLSSYQLNTITKTLVGKPVSDLINAQILLEAKRHLLTTSGQVKEIADHLGYEDVSYFIRFFKKHTGHSPEAFRRNFK